MCICAATVVSCFESSQSSYVAYRRACVSSADWDVKNATPQPQRPCSSSNGESAGSTVELDGALGALRIIALNGTVIVIGARAVLRRSNGQQVSERVIARSATALRIAARQKSRSARSPGNIQRADYSGRPR